MGPRIGAVSYLNTCPLVEGLPDLLPHAQLSFDLPSRLADDLAAGKLDVALIPSIEAFQRPEYVLVSDACIACRGPVWSVRLWSRVPLQEIESLALDEGSRTSVALVQILLQARLGRLPRTEGLPIGCPLEGADTDAVLLIGDRAMQPPPASVVAQWDLGEEWVRWTGLPFVFAMWIARRGRLTPDVEGALAAARDRGLMALDEISDREAARVGLTRAACLGYLRDNLHYRLGDQERRGLQRFYELAAELGMAPRKRVPLGMGTVVS